MIELYTWTTPNGRKVPIMLEEIGLPYNVHPVNFGRQEQFDPDYVRISPYSKIPAIIDTDAPGGPMSLFESAAILIYLADKTGKLLASGGPERYRTLAWLSLQIGAIGPYFGQLGFFAIRSTEKSALAISRFTDEAGRVLQVLERRLEESQYLGGDDYTIADIATYPWIYAANTFQKAVLGEIIEALPALNRWMAAVGGREAVKRGMAVPKV